ncbi:MAG TPA: tRNA 2-thiouridine(34) synthase MnmA [Candidatus Omnitrophota bacterium]|nr:tRNA 2-thiouridine(34) synthase MnmA [Candidatus Omnitrophota bacterium]
MTDKKKKVFVAMSGGVDSSVTAALMKEQGYDVAGVTMRFDIAHPDNKKTISGGGSGSDDARKVARALGIPHQVLDFSENLADDVINDFTEEYGAGRTPNPCVRCNQFVKFGALYDKVMSLGADYLATGHYARILFNKAQHGYELRKAKDSQKDQSYFLYRLDREALSKVLFPLGEFTKPQVRDLARKFRLSVAEKSESQDICFVADAGYKEFIRSRLGDDAFKPGPFRDHKGEIVGEHKGIINYTIGQREKLGIALGHPVYVYKIDKAANTVYVGLEEHLYARGLLAEKFYPIGMNIPSETVEVSARIRYNASEVKGSLTYLGDDNICLVFEKPQKSVTPGQSVVFYRDDLLLGGAVIQEPILDE